MERTRGKFGIQPRHVAIHAQGTPRFANLGATQAVGQTDEIQFGSGVDALIHRATDIFKARDPSRGHGTETVVVIDAEDTQVVVPEIARTPPHTSLGRPGVPRLQGAAHGGIVAQRNSIAIGLGLVSLAEIRIELNGRTEGVGHAQRAQRNRVESAVPQQGRGGLVEVQRLANGLVDILHPESRSDAQSTKTEDILGEDAAGGGLALRTLPGRAGLGGSAGSAIKLIGSVRRVGGHPADQRVVVVPSLPFVADPRLGPEGGVAMGVDGVGVDQVGRVAKSTAPRIALAQRLALVGATPGPRGHQRGIAPPVLQTHARDVSLDAQPVVKVLGRSAVVPVVQQARTRLQREATRLPAVGGRGIHVEGPARLRRGIVHQADGPAVDLKVSILPAEAVALAVIERHQIPQLAIGAIDEGVGGVKAVAAEDVLGAQGKRPIPARLVRYVVERTRRLRPVHERSPATDELQPVHRFEGWCKVHGGVPIEIHDEGHAVLEHQQVLRLMRIADAPVSQAEQTGIGQFADHEAGDLRKGLTVVVALDLRQRVKIEDRDLLARVHLGALNLGRERMSNHIVGVGFSGHVDLGQSARHFGKHLGRQGLKSQQQRDGLDRGQEREPRQQTPLEHELHLGSC